VTGEPQQVPTSEELASLSVNLMHEYEPRFSAANLDLSIGRVRSLTRRGIGLEISGEWDSFTAGRWSLFRRQWVLVKNLAQLEATVRDYLDSELRKATGKDAPSSSNGGR
jgi:hypothetical protein